MLETIAFNDITINVVVYWMSVALHRLKHIAVEQLASC